jgi:hypothetical protein
MSATIVFPLKCLGARENGAPEQAQRIQHRDWVGCARGIEAKIDDAGSGRLAAASDLINNLSLARTIRRDSKNHCTWISFDKDHAVAVVDGVDALIGGATRPTASRPRNFDEPLHSRHQTRC